MGILPESELDKRLARVVDVEDLKKQVELVAKELQEEEKLRTPRAGAEALALEMGLITPEDVVGEPPLPGMPPIRGYYARVGQYVRQVTVPYWDKIKNEFDHTKPMVVQRIDMSEVINAHLRGGKRLNALRSKTSK